MAKKKTSPKKGDKARMAKTTSKKTSAPKGRPSKTGTTRGLKAEIFDLIKASPATKVQSPHQIHAKLKALPGKTPSLTAVRAACISLEADGHLERFYVVSAAAPAVTNTLADEIVVLTTLGGWRTVGEINKALCDPPLFDCGHSDSAVKQACDNDARIQRSGECYCTTGCT